jgi:murein DD-endopeptidase MepM/ murein hydrolase activator NlpD
LLNAPADVQRIMRLLPSALSRKPSATVRFHRRSSADAQFERVSAASLPASHRGPLPAEGRAGTHRFHGPRAHKAVTRPGTHRYGAHPLNTESAADGVLRRLALSTPGATPGSARRLAGRLATSIRTITANPERAASGHATLPLAAIITVLLLAVATTFPHAPLGPTGGPSGDGTSARIAIAGLSGGLDAGDQADAQGQTYGDSAAGADNGGPTTSGLSRLDPEALALLSEPGAGSIEVGADNGVSIDDTGPYFDDGTLVKPMIVDTSVTDGSGLLKTYRVRSGDTLTGIAHRFGVSMMTLWWANDLHSKDRLHIGQVLTIPPVNGLVVVVHADDTLQSIAAKYHVDADDIYKLNKLEDRILVIGQTLILPGARGKEIPEPKQPRQTTSSSSGGSVHQPSRYTGGQMRWPVVGGNNYISQYFHYGHYGLDIAATYGTPVVAAAGGTVTFAGWKDNGGGWQVWISHGSGLYTTYNHMSAVLVSRGQGVGRGQQVGRIGQSGFATGPHLHFEVWRGPVWAGGTRVNPLLYL